MKTLEQIAAAYVQGGQAVLTFVDAITEEAHRNVLLKHYAAAEATVPYDLAPGVELKLQEMGFIVKRGEMKDGARKLTVSGWV